ncbi:MAG: hypothetical protein QXO69_02790 [archaeon]
MAIAIKTRKQDELRQCKEKMNEYYHKNLLYALLVKRYADYIEEREAKTIQDLKEMIQPYSAPVAELAEKIKESIQDYSPEKDILKACEKAYAFITENIHSVPSLGVSFWMGVKETLENGVADYEDKAILLCSLFKALGADSSIGIAELSDGSNRPVVFIKTRYSEVMLDPNEKHNFLEFAGKRADALRKYSLNGKTITKILYEFDDKEYKEY